MRTNDFHFELGPDSNGPMQLRIARSVALAIRQGRLRPGDAMPSIRMLADQLGVHRNTVALAFQELEAEGWVEGRRGSGTYVAQHIPDLTPLVWGPLSDQETTSSDRPGFDLPTPGSLLTPGIAAEFDLDQAARPDVRLAPVDDMAKAYQRALRLHGSELLESGEPKGNPLLREGLALMLARRRGFVVDPEQILITRGSRPALSLLAFALFPKGGAVVVETPGNPGVSSALLQLRGIELSTVPVDGEGLQTEALASLAETNTFRLLHLTPYPQNPTGVALSAARRTHLMELAETHRFAILEEDSDSEWHFDGPRIVPLAAADRGGHVIYLGSLSRILAPGMRLGFLVGPRNLVDRLARIHQKMEWQGDRVLEWSMGDLFRDGVIDRHILRARRIYQERRDLMATYLQEILGDVLEVAKPSAGLSFWARGRSGFDFDGWLLRARSLGVRMQPGSYFSLDGASLAATRLGFGSLDQSEMEMVFERLRKTL